MNTPYDRPIDTFSDQSLNQDGDFKRLNCWEITGCGRGPGGARVAAKGICPAAVESRLDGVNGGYNAGRSCWVIARTPGCGKDSHRFADKVFRCMQCKVYRRVFSEEQRNGYVSPAELLQRLA